MKTLPQIVSTTLKVFLILSVIGLMIKFWSILWVTLSHHFSWEGFIRKFYDGIDFTKIWHTDTVAFNILMLFALLVNILKINLFLSALNILKKIDVQNPFVQDITPILKKISVFAFVIGFSAVLLQGYIELAVSNDLILSTQIGESNYLWLAAIVYIVTLVYQKGISIQSEIDLTI